MVPNGEVGTLIGALRDVCAAPAYRTALRGRATAIAAYYTMERERAYLLRALGSADAP